MAGSPLKVAVIGAGVSGLITAREINRQGLDVVVFEKSDQIGGTWVYTSEVEDDPLGLDPDRKIVHSSLYKSLRANFPPQLMEFTDYPFQVGSGPLSRQSLYFPTHEEVLQFLKNFVRDFGLEQLVRFNTEVVRVEQKDGRWAVESKTYGGMSSEEGFQAVMVCSGHNSKPRLADIPGIEKWSGKQIHSHNYRVPNPYQDEVVVVIGAGPSAYDIAFEISKVAKEVHLSTRDPRSEATKFEMFDNVWQHLKIKYCNENGEVCFEDGALVAADTILYATGFQYDFPFLKTNGIVTIDDNRVGPLYKHVFPPQLAPTLSFVGIPKHAVNFRLMELQAKWVAHVLCGKVSLPSEEEMSADAELYYRRMADAGIPKRHTHTLFLNGGSYPYMDWIAAQMELPPAEEEQNLLLNRVLAEFGVNIKNEKQNSEVEGFDGDINKCLTVKK